MGLPICARLVEKGCAHHLPLSEAPDAHEQFQKKENGMSMVVFNP
jgi:hypothetical protein